MLVVDGNCVFDVVTGTGAAEGIRRRLAEDPDQAAPHVVDAEVLGVIRRHRLTGRLDGTAAEQAVDDLASWPAERWPHRSLLRRAWELHPTVRTWDALYVALAESLGAPLLTKDRRLASASGPSCEFIVVP